MTADTVGGVWTYCLDLARELERAGVEVALATMGRAASEEQEEQVRQLANTKLFQSLFKLEWMPDPWRDVEAAGKWLLRLQGEFQADVVHLNGYCHAALPWKVPVLVACHSCVLSWWEAVKGHEAPGEWSTYAKRVKEGLHAADLVVSPSYSMLKEIDRIYGPLKGATVIPNGRPPADPRPAAKEPFVLSVGRLWDEAKNLEALEAVGQDLRWPIRIAGEGRSKSESVQLLGFLTEPQLQEQFAKASIYCLPAKYEPFGLSVLEAAQHSCALVLGDIPSLRENWSGAALFVPPGGPNSIKSALRGLIEDPSTCARMGELARKRAKDFDSAAMAVSYIEAYQELQENATRRRVYVA